MTHWALSMVALPVKQSKEWMWDEEYGVKCEDTPDAELSHSPSLAGCIGTELYHMTSNMSKTRWILDSGATHHICPSAEGLTNVTPLRSKIRFAVASGGFLSCSVKGELPIKLRSGHPAVVTEVNVVEGAQVHLLSARQLARHGWSVTLREDFAAITKDNEEIQLTDERGLWTADFGAPEGRALNVERERPTIERQRPVVIALRDEHERLGHIGRHKLLKLAHDNELRISHAAALLDPFRITSCDTCQKMKIARKSLNGVSPRGKRDGELVHIDIAGPVDPSDSGHDHFVAMLDDYSKACAVVPMKGRKPAMGLLGDFVTRLETQFGQAVRFIRSDNAPEFVSHAAVDWYAMKGIIHQVSPRYRPELNGTSERFIRTVKEMVGSILDDSSLDHGVWDFAARYAAIILMKTSTGRDGESTWSKYTGRDAGVESVMKFGSPCFVHIPRQTRLKARLDEPKAVPGRIVGQSDNGSGWIVKLDATGEIHRSRDVRFVTYGPARPPPIRAVHMPRRASVSAPQKSRLDGPVQGLAEGSASGPFGCTKRATTYQAPGADVTGPPDSSFDVDGDSSEEVVDRPSRGNGLAAESPATSAVSPSSPASIPGQDSADAPLSRRRIRPSTAWELLPEKTIEGGPHPPASYTDDTGRRVMTRRAPGRALVSMNDDARGGFSESDPDPDASEEERTPPDEDSLLLGWVLSTMLDDDEPRSVAVALSGPNGPHWQAAIDKEIANLKSKRTWDEVTRPVDKRAIGSRMILKLKRDAVGNVVKFKARLVAQGFSQVPGVDFEETYAPVGRTTSLRIMLAISAFMDLEVQQADVEGAYLNGTLDTEIYIRYSEGVEPSDGCDALKLNKALYGLKQAGRLWWQELGSKLGGLGFSKLHSDWGLYVRSEKGGNSFMLLLVYVDDFVIAARHASHINEFLSSVQSYWKLSEMGGIDTILGMKVVRDRAQRKMYLTQPAYIDKIAKQFPTSTNPKFRCSTPLPDGYGNTEDDAAIDATQYQGLIGCLQWLASCTRPDISFTASFLA